MASKKSGQLDFKHLIIIIIAATITTIKYGHKPYQLER